MQLLTNAKKIANNQAAIEEKHEMCKIGKLEAYMKSNNGNPNCVAVVLHICVAFTLEKFTTNAIKKHHCHPKNSPPLIRIQQVGLNDRPKNANRECRLPFTALRCGSKWVRRQINRTSRSHGLRFSVISAHRINLRVPHTPSQHDRR